MRERSREGLFHLGASERWLLRRGCWREEAGRDFAVSGPIVYDCHDIGDVDSAVAVAVIGIERAANRRAEKDNVDQAGGVGQINPIISGQVADAILILEHADIFAGAAFGIILGQQLAGVDESGIATRAEIVDERVCISGFFHDIRIDVGGIKVEILALAVVA